MAAFTTEYVNAAIDLGETISGANPSAFGQKT
jgi:hypothetical protein